MALLACVYSVCCACRDEEGATASHSSSKSTVYNVPGTYLCSSFVTRIVFFVSLGRRMSADAGCAGCRRVELTVQLENRRDRD